VGYKKRVVQIFEGRNDVMHALEYTGQQ